MMEKYITPEGKKHLLKLAFLHDSNASNFNFVALGVNGSSAAVDETESSFIEANNYQREQLKLEETTDETDQSLCVQATFNTSNLDSSEPVTISEIAIVNQDIQSDYDKWFAFMRVPEIEKSSNVSLKYTIIISIE